MIYNANNKSDICIAQNTTFLSALHHSFITPVIGFNCKTAHDSTNTPLPGEYSDMYT